MIAAARRPNGVKGAGPQSASGRLAARGQSPRAPDANLALIGDPLRHGEGATEGAVTTDRASIGGCSDCFTRNGLPDGLHDMFPSVWWFVSLSVLTSEISHAGQAGTGRIDRLDPPSGDAIGFQREEIDRWRSTPVDRRNRSPVRQIVSSIIFLTTHPSVRSYLGPAPECWLITATAAHPAPKISSVATTGTVQNDVRYDGIYRVKHRVGTRSAKGLAPTI